MKTAWYFVFLTIAMVAGKPAKQIFEIPPQFIPDIVKASADCADKLGLDALTILPKFFADQLEDSEPVRKYMYCLGTKTGYVQDDGYLHKERLGKVVGEHKSKVESAVEECNKGKYSNKYETVFNVIQCFRKNSGLQLKV